MSGIRIHPDDVLHELRKITTAEVTEHVWKDGVYQGLAVRYKRPPHPDGGGIFHPYVPLVITGVVHDPDTHEPLGSIEEGTPRVDRDYFLKYGLPVPPGGEE